MSFKNKKTLHKFVYKLINSNENMHLKTAALKNISFCFADTYRNYFIFTALYGMQTRSSDQNFACPSVCPSFCLSVHCDKTEERLVQIFIPYQRSFRLVFFRRIMVGGGDHFYLKFWINRPPLDFEPIFARSASAVTPTERSSVITNRKSTTCFPMSLR